MSKALDSLNSILRYSQAREQQKIDRSLSLLDMGNRLQQQKYAREEQIQRMSIAKEAAKDANESRDLQRELTFDPERIKRKDDIAKTSLEINKIALENAKNKQTDEETDKVFLALDKMQIKEQQQQMKEVVSANIIPSGVLNYLNNKYDEDVTDINSAIKDFVKKRDDKTEIENFIKQPNSTQLINSLIYDIKTSTIGEPKYSKTLKSLTNLPNNYFEYDITKKTNYFKIKPKIDKTISNIEFYDQQENMIDLNQAIQRNVEKDLNKKLRTTLDFIQDNVEGVDEYISPETFELMLGMLNPETGKNYTREELGL